MRKGLVVFGAGKIAEAVSYFFNRDSDYQIEAYILDDLYALNDTYLDKPVLKISELSSRFSTDECHVFVAVGYQGINSMRTQKYKVLKEMGYSFASYVSPLVKGDFTFGENTIVMDHAMVQPCVKFGDNVFVWGGAMVGHHAVIGDNCWLTGGCMIGGLAKIGSGTFMGLGAMVGHEVRVGEKCMLGAATLTTKSIGDKVVLVASSTEPHRLNSEQFTRMSTCFRT